MGFLAHIYFQNEDYIKALPILESILSSIKFEIKNKGDKFIGDMEFPYDEYLDTVQLIGIIHHILGNQDKSMHYLNFVLNNLPEIKFEKGIEDEILSFMDAFFIRMRFNIQKNKTKEVLQDYQKVKEYLSWGDWENEYVDVIKYITDRKLTK